MPVGAQQGLEGGVSGSAGGRKVGQVFGGDQILINEAKGNALHIMFNVLQIYTGSHMPSHWSCGCRNVPNPISSQRLPWAAGLDGELLCLAWSRVLHCPIECFKGGPSEASEKH